ncbi:MAG: YccF domain-containing protein [Clostridiaceae bacterium]
MGCLGNIIWIICGGLICSLGWLFFGALWCLTIVGIPIGVQCFKIASLQLAPFGKEIVMVDYGGISLIANVLWLIFGGLELAIGNLIAGIFMCATIIGIPFGIQFFKLAQLSLMPFGKDIR